MNKNNGTPSAVPIIDHVGIAVNSLETALPKWAAMLGCPAAGEEEVPSERVRVAFFGGGPGRVELLEPTDPGSAIHRFLRSRGEGIHHVCMRVPDLEASLRDAAAAGVEAVPPAIRVGAGGSRVSFLHPGTTGGVLLELREAREAG